jgi:hypothetical protein
MSAFGNILSGVLQGVDDHIINPSNPSEKEELVAEFPNRHGEDDSPEMQVRILGMKPINFGLVALGIFGGVVLTMVAIRKYSN